MLYKRMFLALSVLVLAACSSSPPSAPGSNTATTTPMPSVSAGQTAAPTSVPIATPTAIIPTASPMPATSTTPTPPQTTATAAISFTKVSTFGGSLMGADDGLLAKAMFNTPIGLSQDRLGNIYVADNGNHRIRKISPGGVVITFSGSSVGFSDGGNSAVKFREPYDVIPDNKGLLYVSDRGNNRIRRINAEGSATTVAGSSTKGYLDGNGATALLDSPSGMALAPDGHVYFADSGNHCIRKMSSTGVVSTVAGAPESGFGDGSLTQARFKAPLDVAFSPQGDRLYVADTGNNRIRMIDLSLGTVSTVAGKNVGFKDGQGEAAEFKGPEGITVNAQGLIYAVEFNNNSVRQITPTGQVTTITRASAVSGSTDGLFNIASFNGPQAILALDKTLLVSDSFNHRLRRVE